MDASFWMTVAQFGYGVTFLLAAVGTLYFVLERGTVKASVKGVATTAALVSLVTAFQYSHMREMVGFGGDFTFPTEYRYLGWVIVFPMIVLMAQKFLGMKRDAHIMRVVLASIVMVVASWMTEFQGYGWVGFWICVLAWAYVAFMFHGTDDKKSSCWCMGKKFIVFGWAIIPLGALAHMMNVSSDMMIIRDIAYTLVDVVLVLLFAHKCVTADRK